MALHTPLTELFGIDHPIVLAPMGDVSGGRLAAAVSEGGGLGLIGGGRGDLTMLATECALARENTEKPCGVGLLTWAVNQQIVDWVIAQRPAAIMLSFGDPGPFAKAVHDADIPLLSQVHTLDEAKQALDAGVQVLVAQGREAGGHHGGRSTLPFVPAVVDLAHGTPVLAAGGIGDGRGLAAALTLGAAGAMIGTRFEATHESLLSAAESKVMLKAKAEDTTTGRAIDIAARPLETRWPAQYPARTLRSVFSTCFTPSAAALRRMLPALPASCSARGAAAISRARRAVSPWCRRMRWNWSRQRPRGRRREFRPAGSTATHPSSR